jgi:hypothetical protein
LNCDEETSNIESRTSNAMGGTGVAPVKSGVTPDFAMAVSMARRRKIAECGRSSCDAFGRDARNHRPEACATRHSFNVGRWVLNFERFGF